MLHFLNLIRYKNLMIIAGTQLLFKFFLIDTFFKETALSDGQFILLIIATLCIAAAGYIINDIQDVEIDKINKPEQLIINQHISEKRANNFYLIFNFIGVLLGFYISNIIGKTGFAVVFVLISGLLYLYATSLKQYLIISNIVVAILVSISILIIGLFDVLPIMTTTNEFLVKYHFKILLIYTGFAFYTNLLREVIKDIQDIDGDYTNKMKTLPIVLGKQRTIKLISVLSLFIAVAVFYYMYSYLSDYQVIVFYMLGLIIAPVIYFSFLAWEAEKKKDFSKLSILLKLIMILGVLSIIPIHFYALKGF
ncbi:prenyltransferase [Flavobacteriaceae bacterium R38]|nr:prenyltransferase [Flavobacteriaceae bacterium R38]